MPITRSLKYGDGTLELIESEDWIAWRPHDDRPAIPSPILEAASCGESDDPGPSLVGLRLARAGGQADRLLAQLALSPAVARTSRVYHTSNDQVPFVPTGEIHIGFEPELPARLQGELMVDLGLELVAERPDGSFVVSATETSPDPITSVESLQECEGVRFAEPDLATPSRLRDVAPAAQRYDDPELGAQWHLRNTGRHGGSSVFFKERADARVVEAWRSLRGFGSADVVIGVIDREFDLDDRGPLPGLRSGGRLSAEAGCASGPSHGTTCARVAAGRPRGGTVGVAPGASLLTRSCGGELSDRHVEAWFDDIREAGAWIVSCGWGPSARSFPLSRRKSEAIHRCATAGRNAKGCVIVFAAGNESRSISDPEARSFDGFAMHPDVVAVAASNSRDLRSHYSNFGSGLWLCAPSSGAAGAGVPTGAAGPDPSGSGSPCGGSFGAGGGTSFAAAVVSGVAALVLSANPELSASDVKTILRLTARKIGQGYDRSGHARHFGYGCVDAAKAVDMARGFNVVSLLPARPAG